MILADLAVLKGQRRETKRKVTIDELPERERPTQLRPMAKMFTALLADLTDAGFRHPETGMSMIDELT